jgi:hypothetical protein
MTCEKPRVTFVNMKPGDTTILPVLEDLKTTMRGVLRTKGNVLLSQHH